MSECKDCTLRDRIETLLKKLRVRSKGLRQIGRIEQAQAVDGCADQLHVALTQEELPL